MTSIASHRISNRQARRFLIEHQGLGSHSESHSKKGVLDFIRRVGCIQFDPMDVVGRNPDLVLQSRIPDYRPWMLQELLYTDRALLDGWDKQMSIYPIDDWPNFHRRRYSSREWLKERSEEASSVVPQVRQVIQERGPISSLDLDIQDKVDWFWAPARAGRAALESMFTWGELIIHHRERNRKVYDFAHRHLPGCLVEAIDPHVTDEDYWDWHVLRRIGSVGLMWTRMGDAWRGIWGLKSPQLQAAVGRLLERGMLVQIEVEGITQPLYARTCDWERLNTCLDADPVPRASIIAPLDNLIWDRNLIQALFGFRYRWEVYTPKAKREYGYYVLPVLLGDRFIARMEAKRSHDHRGLYIAGWWWEEDVPAMFSLNRPLRDCLAGFVGYLGSTALGESACGDC